MNIYDYKNRGYLSTPKTPLRSAYKSTYLDEEGLSSNPRDLNRSSRDADPKTATTPATNMAAKPAIRGRREMFRIESKLYDNEDVDLNAEKDLSPIAPVPNGRDWTGTNGESHNRSVSTTSNNNGYHIEPRHDACHGRNNNSNNQDYVDKKNRNMSLTSNNHDTLDRSVFSTTSGQGIPNGDLRRSASKQGHPDMNNRSILPLGNSTYIDQSVMSTRSELNDLNKSSVSQMNDINRSVLSTRSILSNRHGLTYRESMNQEHTYNANGDLNRSASSKDYEHSLSASLTRDQSKFPSHKQNGFVQPVRESLNQSQRSLNLSLTTRALSPHTIQSALLNISFICVLALILVAISLQLLFKLSGRSLDSGAVKDSLLSNHSFVSTAEVAVPVCSVVVMLDLCCLLICSMQAVFAAKLLRCSQGSERAYKYLKECASTRFIAVTGFFISIPFLLFAVLLYLVMEFRTTSAIISTVVMAVGLIFMLLTVGHSTYYWRKEKECADSQLPVYTGNGILGAAIDVPNLNELSTLV